MTQQLDMMPGEFVSESLLARIDAQLPKQREVKSPRLPSVLPVADGTAEETFHDEHHAGDSHR